MSKYATSCIVLFVILIGNIKQTVGKSSIHWILKIRKFNFSAEKGLSLLYSFIFYTSPNTSTLSPCFSFLFNRIILFYVCHCFNRSRRDAIVRQRVNESRKFLLRLSNRRHELIDPLFLYYENRGDWNECIREATLDLLTKKI